MPPADAVAAGMMADEDMQFLNQIAISLTQRFQTFRIQLAAGVHIANTEASVAASFAGLDQVKSLQENLTKMMPNENKFELVMAMTTPARTKVGEIWGMDIIADPTIPKDQFRIQPVSKTA